MITYQVFVDNIFQSTIQANSRQQAVALAHSEWKCAGIHISKEEESQWWVR